MTDKKIINLDALIDEGKDLVIGGKTYTLREASVVQLLDFIRKTQSASDMDKLVVVIDLLYALSPEAKEAKAFDSLNMRQVQHIIDNFVMGSVQNPVTEAAKPAASLEDAASKKK